MGAIQGAYEQAFSPLVGPQAKSPAMPQARYSLNYQVSKPVLKTTFSVSPADQPGRGDRSP